MKLFTVFYSYFNTKLNLAYETAKSTNFKKPTDIARFAGDFLLLFWVEAVIGEYLLGRAPDFEDDEEDPYLWNIKLILSNLAATLPLIKEISSSLQGFDSGPAGLRGLGEVGKAIGSLTGQATNLVEGEEVDIDKVIKSLNSAGGIVFKYPSSQINVVLNAMEKAQEGKEVAPIDYLIYKK